MVLCDAVRAAFDKQPVVRLAAAKAILRSYVAAPPQHPWGLCYWLHVRGVAGEWLIQSYRAADEGQAPSPFSRIDSDDGPTPRRVEFARKLLGDLEAYLAGGAA